MHNSMSTNAPQFPVIPKGGKAMTKKNIIENVQAKMRDFLGRYPPLQPGQTVALNNYIVLEESFYALKDLAKEARKFPMGDNASNQYRDSIEEDLENLFQLGQEVEARKREYYHAVPGAEWRGGARKASRKHRKSRATRKNRRNASKTMRRRH